MADPATRPGPRPAPAPAHGPLAVDYVGVCLRRCRRDLVGRQRGAPGRAPGPARGSSLARLLAEHRGVRNHMDLPRLTARQLLEWADAYHERTGGCPNGDSGLIPEAPGETWGAVDTALQRGRRGLPGGSSLARFLHEHRGVRDVADPPPLGPRQLLRWADAHHRRTGRWPNAASGPVAESPGETWCAVDLALRVGRRGLPGGSSLPRLLEEERGARNVRHLPPLAIPQILAWADAHREQTGDWPTPDSGPIPEAPGETWTAVESALSNRRRSLPGGSSLAKLLARERGVRNPHDLPRLRLRRILAWADTHHRRAGKWPTVRSGAVPAVPGETWQSVDWALRHGWRGPPGGSSLARLLEEQRGVRNIHHLPPLTVPQILAWADAHHRRTGT